VRSSAHDWSPVEAPEKAETRWVQAAGSEPEPAAATAGSMPAEKAAATWGESLWRREAASALAASE
jgi:hypothetical protein